MKPTEKDTKVTVGCDFCKGKGYVKNENDTQVCPTCDGQGYAVIDIDVYYRQLQAEQKHRKEVEK